MIEQLKNSIAQIDIEIAKLGDSPEHKVNSYKTILQGCRERKDKDGVKVWEKKVSDAELRAVEFKKLNRKRHILKDALSTLTDSKHPDFQRVELDYLTVCQAADAAYKGDVSPVHFDEVVKQEPYIRHSFHELKQRPLRGWRMGKMSALIQGGF